MSWRVLLLLAILALGGCRDRSDAKALAQIVREYLQHHPAAPERLDAYLAKYPQDTQARVIRGNWYENAGEDRLAEAAYEQALQVDPKCPEALTGLGIVRRKQQRYPEAMRYYEQAVVAAPSYAPAWASMVTVALKLGQDAKGLECGRRAYALQQTDPSVVANLAIACHCNGLAEERDRLAAEAERLGYPQMRRLHLLFQGRMTIRDEDPPVPAAAPASAAPASP